MGSSRFLLLFVLLWPYQAGGNLPWGKLKIQAWKERHFGHFTVKDSLQLNNWQLGKCGDLHFFG